MLLNLLPDIREHILRYCTVNDMKALACTSSDYTIALKEELYHTVRIPWKKLENKSYLKQRQLKKRIKALKDTKVLLISFPLPEQNHFYRKPNILKWICKLGHLVELDLSYSYSLDDSNVCTLAKGLPSLEALSLLCCYEITDAGLSYVSTLIKLKKLILYACSRITDKGMSYISSLVALKTLDLCLCQDVTQVGFSLIGNLIALEDLRLMGCGITDSEISILSTLVMLKRLGLYRCRHVTGLGFSYLKTNLALEELSLCDENKTDSCLSHVSALVSLKKLDLHCSVSFTDLGLSRVGSLFTLKELYLVCGPDNKITDNGMSSISTLSMLEVLNLTTYCITDAGFSCLGNLFGLKELSLECCGGGVTDKVMSYISTLTKLKRLDVNLVRITDTGISYLRNSVALEELSLRYCKISDVGLSNLSTMIMLKTVRLNGMVYITASGTTRLEELNFNDFCCDKICDFLKNLLV